MKDSSSSLLTFTRYAEGGDQEVLVGSASQLVIDLILSHPNFIKQVREIFKKYTPQRYQNDSYSAGDYYGVKIWGNDTLQDRRAISRYGGRQSGELSRSWDVEFSKGKILAVNTAPYAQYVFGGHKLTPRYVASLNKRVGRYTSRVSRVIGVSDSGRSRNNEGALVTLRKRVKRFVIESIQANESVFTEAYSRYLGQKIGEDKKDNSSISLINIKIRTNKYKREDFINMINIPKYQPSWRSR